MKKANEEQATKFAGVFVEHHKLLTSAPSSEIQWAIQNPQDAIALFVLALVNRGKQVGEQIVETAKQIVKRTLTPWKIIQVGDTTTEKLLETVEKTGREISPNARDLTTKPAFKIAEKPEQVNLVILTPRELGFTRNPRTDAFLTKEFCAKWSVENLQGQVIELCEPEDGPQLASQHPDQPNGEILWMAMERITDSDGNPDVFRVGRRGGGELWLGAGWARPGDEWNLDARIVFRFRTVTLPSAV